MLPWRTGAKSRGQGEGHNAILKAFYLRPREKGKPAKLALTTVMRKLTVLLNRLLKNPQFILVS